MGVQTFINFISGRFANLRRLVGSRRTKFEGTSPDTQLKVVVRVVASYLEGASAAPSFRILN